MAGITTGALYTRYQNKDALFCSLVTPALKEISSLAAPAAVLYDQARRDHSPETLLLAIRAEEQLYFDLLLQHYDACVLFFCKSSGSSLEIRTNEMMRRKAEQTVSFFADLAGKEIDGDGIRILMYQQFDIYRRMLEQNYKREKVISCLKTVDRFLEAGWKSILKDIM